MNLLYVALLAAVIGQKLPPNSVGLPDKMVRLTPQMVEELHSQILMEELAEKEIDPETFDLPN